MNDPHLSNDSEIKEKLGMGQGSKRRIPFKAFTILGLLFLLLCAWLFLNFLNGPAGESVNYITAEVEQDDLTVTVSATGNVEPLNQVDVGSEVSGTIESVMVDYNDFIKAGQILAKLDTTKLEAQASQSRAALELAKADLLQSQATLFEVENEFARLKHIQELSQGKLPSKQDMDSAEAALKRAQAAKAMVYANIAEAEAKLKVNLTDLEKAVIISPINGVVLERDVEPGQTVAASLQAPVLFTLAEDLTKMELHVDVDEADVGQVKDGQMASFTVDAFPDRIYPAHIKQVRYGPKSTDGVVTYLAILNIDNSDLSLRPGMTASADIVVKHVKDALMVPNAALRFSPSMPEEEKKTAKSGGSLLSKLFPRPPDMNKKKRDIDIKVNAENKVWTLVEGKPVAIPVMIGSTSAGKTEIISGDVKPGMPLIVEAEKTK